MQHIFINSFGCFKQSVNFIVHKNIETAKCPSHSILNSQYIAGNYNYTSQQYHISQKKLLLSGDIELNPGPVQNNSLTQLPSNIVLQQRLRRFQLRPL
jgi:hypothetical protein